jgi:pimeloyl-ACP methyl ester carboxylesterase
MRPLAFSAALSLAVVASAPAQAFPRDQLYATPGVRVNIGKRALNLYCSGKGTPTVVLEAGLGGRASAWSQVQSKLWRDVRVCSYDRAGYAFSDPGPEPRTAERLADDLHRALDRAQEHAPYILVGATFGAFVVRLFAVHHASEVAGTVLLNPSPEDEELTLASPAVERIDREGLQHAIACRDAAKRGELQKVGAEARACLPPPNPQLSAQLNAARIDMLRKPQTWAALVSEWRAIRDSAAQVKATRARRFAFPLVVISAGHENGFDGTAADRAALHQAWLHWSAWQNDIARISSDSLHLRTADDSRTTESTNPSLVISAVRRAIAALRGHRKVHR